MPAEWMTTAEAAVYTRRHRKTVLNAAADGRLQSAQPGQGGHRRYRREWLDAWLTGEAPRHLRSA